MKHSLRFLRRAFLLPNLYHNCSAAYLTFLLSMQFNETVLGKTSLLPSFDRNPDIAFPWDLLAFALYALISSGPAPFGRNP
jgi:hypothetical protein